MQDNAKHPQDASLDSGPKQSAVKGFFNQPDIYLGGNVEITVRRELIEQLLADRSIGNLIDIGCGDGSLSMPFLQRASSATFLDFSQAMIDKLSARLDVVAGSGMIRVMASRFEEADLPLSAFDTVLCVGVLSHVESIEAFLNRVSGIMAPSGLAVIQISDADKAVYHVMQFLRNAAGPFCNNRGYTLNKIGMGELTGITASLGWRLVATKRYVPPPPGINRILAPRPLTGLLRRGASSPAISTFGSECLALFQKRSAL